MEKSLFTSDGSESYSMTPRALLYIMLSIEKAGNPISIGNPWGGLGQLEDKFLNPSDFGSSATDRIGMMHVNTSTGDIFIFS